MLSVRNPPFRQQNRQQNRQHTSLRIPHSQAGSGNAKNYTTAQQNPKSANSGKATQEGEELGRLRRENRWRREEREILERAAAWFAGKTDSIIFNRQKQVSALILAVDPLSKQGAIRLVSVNSIAVASRYFPEKS